MRVAPALCQAFKGSTASTLYEIYNGEGGIARLELDLAVASEISEQVQEALGQNKDKTQGKAIGNRLHQRRAARQKAASQAITDDDAVKLLKDAGVLSE
tara:strand:- start:415 stop:711 length:297 start_codon:yes stop_codon:yes gene_type:complete